MVRPACFAGTGSPVLGVEHQAVIGKLGGRLGRPERHVTPPSAACRRNIRSPRAGHKNRMPASVRSPVGRDRICRAARCAERPS
jgi:hypothetical protein